MVTFNNFQALSLDRRETTWDLFRHARRQRSAFTSFASTWFAFNGWMECVTDARNDAAMVTAIADNRRMTDAYAELMEDADFARAVRQFTTGWPVINVRDARRKLGPDVFWVDSREELIRRCDAAEVKMQPEGWDKDDIPTWPQLLKTIYMIRCNFFHGAKSPLNLRDQRLIRDSDKVLTMLIERSGCFDWSD